MCKHDTNVCDVRPECEAVAGASNGAIAILEESAIFFKKVPMPKPIHRDVLDAQIEGINVDGCIIITEEREPDCLGDWSGFYYDCDDKCSDTQLCVDMEMGKTDGCIVITEERDDA